MFDAVVEMLRFEGDGDGDGDGGREKGRIGSSGKREYCPPDNLGGGG
jgi:hypothetical protein